MMRGWLTVAVVLVLAGCASGPVASQPLPSPGPSPSDCWIAYRGEYRLLAFNGNAPSESELEMASTIVRDRLMVSGLSQFQVRVTGDGLVVELPLVARVGDVRSLLIEHIGVLKFVPVPDGVDLAIGDPVPPGLQPLLGRESVQKASVTTDQSGQDVLLIEFTPDASQAMADFTAANFGRILAIVLDGVVLAAPIIQGTIDGGSMQIAGGFTRDQYEYLANVLVLAALPGQLQEVAFEDVAMPSGCPGAA